MIAAPPAKIVPLSRPAQAHGEEIATLQFREPTGEDAWACGMPIRFNQDGEILIAMPVAMSLAARLAAVPLSTIKSLPLVDLMAAVGAVTGFFMGSGTEQAAPDTAPSNDASISRGSGDPIPLPSLRSG